MFISEEIHRDLINKFKADYKPYLSTQENILHKSLNEVPGLYCAYVKVKEEEYHGTPSIVIVILINVTRLGMINYGLLFDEMTNSLDQTIHLTSLTYNKIRPDDPNDPDQWPGIDTRIMLGYRVCVKDPDELARTRYNTLFLMNIRATKTKYAKSLVIKMNE